MNLTTPATSCKWNHSVLFFSVTSLFHLPYVLRAHRVVACVADCPLSGSMIFHCVCIAQFVYPSVNRHLDYFHLLPMMNSVGLKISLRSCFQFFWYVPRSTMFSMASASFYNPSKSVQGFQLLHILTHTNGMFSYNSHSNRYEVTSHCGFLFEFIWLEIVSIYSYPCW